MKLRRAAWWAGSVLVAAFVATRVGQQLFDLDWKPLAVVQLFAILIGGLTLLYLGLTEVEYGARDPKLSLNEPKAEDGSPPPQ